MNSNNKFYLAACFFALQGCADPAERSAEYLESAKAYYEQKNYAKAKVEFKNALQIDNKLASAYYHLALINEKDKHWKGMFVNLIQTVKIDPGNIDARMKLARLYLLSGELEKAKVEVEWLRSNAVENLDAMALLGTILLKQGDTDAALVEAEKVLAINPGHLDAVSLQIVVYMQRHDYQNAEAKVNRAIESKPNELALNILKLQVHTESNNAIAIEQDYKNLIKRFPENHDFTYALAKFYASSQRDIDAVNLLQNIVDKNPELLKPKLVLTEYLEQKDRVEAEASLKRFIKERPNEAELYFRLANIYILKNQIDDAKASLNWIVEHKDIEIDGLNARILLAKLAVQEGDNGRAAALIREVQEVDSQNFSALVLKARLSLIGGLFDDAITNLRGLLRDYPESDEVTVLLGQAYLKKNSPALAEEFFRKALEINPANFSAVMPVVTRMVQSKDIGRADEILQKALMLKPGHAAALQALAQIRLLKKDWQGTQEVVELIAAKPKGKSVSYYLSGKISQGQGLYTEALRQYQLALSVTPRLFDALNSMLECYEALKQRDKMFVYLDDFMQEHPELSYPLILKSQLYVRGKDWGKALAILQKGIKQWPEEPKIYGAMASVYSEKGNKQKVIDTYKQGLVKIPDNIRLRMFLASAYEGEGDFDNALQNYEIIIGKYPDLDVAVNNIVSLLLDHYPSKENNSRAVKLAQRFETSEQPYYLDTYGWALLHNGNVKEAVFTFKNVVSKVPDVAVFKYHLGLAYKKNKQNLEALEVLEQALVVGAAQGHFVEKDKVESLLDALNAASENQIIE